MLCINFIPVTDNVKQLSEESRSHLISGGVISGKDLTLNLFTFLDPIFTNVFLDFFGYSDLESVDDTSYTVFKPRAN